MYSKAKQISKNKKPKPRKMTRNQYINYVDFIREKSKHMCQIPNCSNIGQDIAHKDRAYKRDDRFVALLCRHHHTIADNPNPKQIDESSKVNLALSAIAKENWKAYQND